MSRIKLTDAITAKSAAERERLAYHFILSAIVLGAADKGESKWGSLKRVGSVYDAGDTYVWQIAFTPRMIDAVIMETFTTKDGQESVRCFYLADLYHTYANRSFDSKDVSAKMQGLYWHAVEMERIAQNAECLRMAAAG